MIAFNAAVGPAGIAPAVLDKLPADICAVVASPQFAERTRNLGIDARGNSPAELDAWMRTEIAKWARIARGQPQVGVSGPPTGGLPATLGGTDPEGSYGRSAYFSRRAPARAHSSATFT